MKPVRPFFSGLLLVSFALCCAIGVYMWRQTNLPPKSSDTVVPIPEIKVVAVGNVSCGANTTVTEDTCQAKAVTDAIAKEKPAAVLLLGNLQYNKGSDSEYQGVFTPLWAELKDKTHAVTGKTEYLTPGAEGFFNYWNDAERSSKYAGDRTKGYFSFDITGWHIVALNSNCAQVGGCSLGSPQAVWLRQDLRGNKTRCTLAFWNEPRYPATTSSNANSAASDDFWLLLDDQSAELVLNAAEPLYQRLSPRRADGTTDPVLGIRQFIVGTGGYSKSNKATDASEQGTFTDAKSFGYLVLKLRTTSYSWQYKTINDQLLDQGTTQCH